MQKSDSIQPRSCLIQKKHVAELVRRRSKNLKFSEKIVGLVKITLNFIDKSHIRRVIYTILYAPYTDLKTSVDAAFEIFIKCIFSKKGSIIRDWDPSEFKETLSK